LGGIGLLFFERGDVRRQLPVLGIHAGGRGVQVAPDPIEAGRLQGVQVDERIVVQDLGMVGGDKAHAAHVRGQGIDLVHAAGRRDTIVPAPQVQLPKLLGVRRAELGGFEIDPPDPIALASQRGDQVVPDKASSTGDDDLIAIRHREFLYTS
jgi:hypothetical protein